MTRGIKALALDELHAAAESARAVRDGMFTVNGEDDIRDMITGNRFDRGELFLLKVEAWLLNLAHAYNKIMSLSNSRTRILAHQVESTHRIINSLGHRFLIADEVGLGKTVEAGLVIKELQFRYGYGRVLIVCPSSLQSQWQSEMAGKFNDRYDLVDRRSLDAARRKIGKKANPWEYYDRAICSLDFIKNKEMAEDLQKTSWDIVVFDEAHRLRRDSKQSTLSYNVAELISRRTRALLLLSATPFRGKLEELFYLIALLDKNILGPFSSFYRKFCIESGNIPSLKGVLSPVVIRRTKKEVGGFTRRHAVTVRFELFTDERLLYDETTRYVAEEYNRAMASENRAVGFVMTVFQKLLDSSSGALYRALSNRLARLREEIVRLELRGVREDEADDIDVDLFEEVESPDEVCAISARETAAEMRREVVTLEKLVALAGEIQNNKKGDKLLELLGRIIGEEGKKVVIFTQFVTTQMYLRGLLADYRVEIFNGGMGRDEKDDAIARFKETADILICTEAGGEGRNLQFCNVLVNYDLPWSPLKIEQRIGRIHRFGQKFDVFIYNFATRDTVAERVLEILTVKLKVFEQSIGAMDVLLGEIEEEMSLNCLFMDLATGRKSRRDVEGELSERIHEARSSYEKLADLTVASKLDFNYDEYYRITLKERKFCSNRIESFINGLARVDDSVRSMVRRKKGTKGIYSVGFDATGRECFGTFDSSRALEREDLQFLAFGHPIVDAAVKRTREDEFGGRTAFLSAPWEKRFFGIAFIYMVTFTSMADMKELIPVVIDCSGSGDEDSCREMEARLLQNPLQFVPAASGKARAGLSAAAVRNVDRHLTAARIRLFGIIGERADSMAGSMDIKVYPEIDKIEHSYGETIAELKQKLDLQESRMKWYGEDLRGAITRTKNSIKKMETEKNEILEKYRGYLGIGCSAEMLAAAFIISE